MSGSPRPKVVVVGSIMVDRVVKVPTIVRPGETLTANSIEVHPGGKGANQAAAAALAGATVVFAGRTGADGAFVLEALAACGVDVAPSRIDEGASGTAFVQVAANGENAIAIVPEANGRFDRDDLDRALRPVRAGDLLLLQNETALLGPAIEAGRASRGMVWLNAAPAIPPVPESMLELVDVLIVNEHEAAVISGIDEPRDALECLCARLAKALIVVTMGPAGVIAGHGARRWSQPAFAVEAVDTVGCGDAFVGAMAAAVVRGEEIESALREGCAAGAIAATREGAIPSLPSREEIAAMLSRVTR